MMSIHNISDDEVLLVVEKALKVLKKSKHFEFFKNNLYDFAKINDYKGFAFMDEFDATHFDSSFSLSFNTNYLCWLVTICAIEGFGDDNNEFDNDLWSAIDLVCFVKNELKKEAYERVFDEIKYFLSAYKILCQPYKKLLLGVDIELWRTDVKEYDNPKRDWYFYYLPVNLDENSRIMPSHDETRDAREKINPYKQQKN